MVRAYSEVLIAIDIIYSKTKKGIQCAVVVAEDFQREGKAKPNKYEVFFYGKMADEVNSRLTVGAKFTFRGMVANEDDETRLVGMTLATIA